MSTWRAWLAPERRAGVQVDERERRAIVVELVIVFTITLGLAGVRSLLSLLDALLQEAALADQQVAINVRQANVEFIDMLRQLLGAVQLFAWGALGLYLLWRAGLKPRAIGLDWKGRDLAGGAGLAALIGIPGLAFYFIARAAGANLTVLPSTLDDTWWRPVVLTVAAAANAWAEEVLVVGYLISRLRQLGLRENSSLLVAGVLRGSYHLYQGFGGFVGNLVMGLVFGRVWQRTNRLWPLIVAHTLLDVVAFVGYSLLRGTVSWLP